MWRLYSYVKARSPKGPEIVLRLLGITHEVIEVDLAAGGQFNEDFKRRNPLGRVPVLVTPEGLVLTQSGAMMRYLARIHPDAGLIPTDPMAEAWVNEIIDMMGSELRPFGNRSTVLRLLQEKGLKPSDRAAANDWCIYWIIAVFTALEEMLKNRQYKQGYCIGAQMTLADIVLGVEVWAALERFPTTFDKAKLFRIYPHIWGVFEQMRTLDTFNEACPPPA